MLTVCALLFVVMCHLVGYIDAIAFPNLDEKCNGCRDWYGRCKQDGAEWIDDQTWSYRCEKPTATFIGCLSTDRANKQLINDGQNVTVNGFWFSCKSTAVKVHYEQEPHCKANNSEYHVGEKFRDGVFQRICLQNGIWVVGCFYQDAELGEKLLQVGEDATTGVILHHCQRYSDFPGRVQYFTKVRKDIKVETPQGKGTNKNRPQLLDNRLTFTPTPWLHRNAAQFVQMDGRFDVKIRFLD